MKFYGYGARLEAALAITVLVGRLLTDAHDHDPSEPMGTHERHWEVRIVGTLDLVLLPHWELLWGEWDEAVGAFAQFMSDWENVELFFDMQRQGHQGVVYRIATGYIMRGRS